MELIKRFWPLQERFFLGEKDGLLDVMREIETAAAAHLEELRGRAGPQKDRGAEK